LFLGLQQVENQLFELILEYYAKSEATVDFFEIYSKPFGKPYKHWKFLTEKLTQFDEKTKSLLWKSNLKLEINGGMLERYKRDSNKPWIISRGEKNVFH